MLSQGTIPKKKTSETALDYQQLYAIGLKHVQNLSSRIWTDYNVHDPGITILELLCYALTDLSYRASFPVEDILASESANSENMKKQFFTARQILPNRSLTLSDYRKLLIDLKGVKNAWLQPATLSYYADTFDGKLLGSATLLVGELVDLPSFAAKIKQPSEGVSQYLSGRLSEGTRQALSAYQGTESNPEPLQTALIQDLNKVIEGVSIYEAQRFAAVNLSAETDTLHAQNVQGKALTHLKQLLLNRLLLEDAYPQEISKNQPLRQKSNLLGIVEVKIGGLYDAIIEYEEEADKQKVMQDVKQKLQSNRNLCEDFVNFIEVDTQSFLLCAELELTPDADVARVKAEILFQVEQYLVPPVNNYSLSEMLARTKADGTPYTADEIFDGPILDCGFIDDDELAKADLRHEIRLSDIISIIMDIEGLQAVRDIVINPRGTQIPLKNKWVMPIESKKKAILSHDLKAQDNHTEKPSRLVFYKRNMPVVPDHKIATDYYSKFTEEAQAKAETPAIYDFDIPLGNYRKLNSYYSFQNHFPVVYGLSEVGLNSAADDKRKALAYQLKAYLLFFDQIMANYFAQLSHVKELFSTDPNLHRTYFYQVVESFAEFSKIYSPTDVVASIENEVEDTSVLIERRNRFLDHLIARFAERFNDFVYIMYSAFGASPESIVKDKCQFLNNYPQISSERALAYNYSLKNDSDLWNTENVSGLEKRLARLLGISNYKRRNLGDIAYDIYAELDNTPGDEFRFRIRKKDTLEILLSSSTNYATPEIARQVMGRAIDFALLPSGYECKVSTNNKHYFNIIDDRGEVVARRIEYFDTEAKMNNAINEVMEYLRVNYSGEGMYLIENILLRPEEKDDPFLPICPTPNCTDCAELDPYSYRIHIILPAYGSRFNNMEFRRFTEEVIREETPAHILPKICWINKEDMAKFEKVYRDWLYLKAGVEKAQRGEKLKNFIDKLFKVKSIYPTQKLRECDSGEDQPKFILGRTALGTGKEIKP